MSVQAGRLLAWSAVLKKEKPVCFCFFNRLLYVLFSFQFVYNHKQLLGAKHLT